MNINFSVQNSIRHSLVKHATVKYMNKYIAAQKPKQCMAPPPAKL